VPGSGGGKEAFEVEVESADGPVRLAGEAVGGGPPVVLLHGITATRRSVVHGSKHLVRRGHRLIAYDARGHGESSPAPHPAAYEYRHLVSDLGSVLERLGLERPAVAGSSMGAATALAFALAQPRNVAALVQITPAYDGSPSPPEVIRSWDRLADALEDGGVDAFLEASEPEGIPERWRETARTATRQRLERNRRLDAVADALRVVARSRPWEGLEPLERLEVPTLVVGSRDDADELHPLRVAEAYAARLPDAELIVEREGESPIAWRGARLSREIADFLGRARGPRA
jgi:pimeloyl-ACP methyl ester carboxylesterase